MQKVKYQLKRTKQKLGIVLKYYRNGNFKLRAKYAKYYQELKIEKNTILFESRDGQSFTDSPFAIYLFMLEDERFKNYKFYWTYTDKSEENIKDVKQDKRVKFIKRNSDEYLRALTSCQYVVNNSTFQNFYTKKEGQKYINTWHGTPLKQMGFDIPNEVFGARNVLRNLLMADYFISPNEYTSNIFRSAYKLDGLYEGEILENGYPRIDLTTCQEGKEEFVKYLNTFGLNIDLNKKIILYTPTWKGNNFAKPRTSTDQLAKEVDYLQKELGDEYQLLCKVHPFAYNQVKESGYIDDILIPDSIDANQLLSITDILITDYSSIFFDYLVTDKPIIFYCWDREGYSAERGLYLPESDLPGPVETTIFDVLKQIKSLDDVKLKYKDNYQKMKEQMCSYQDGNVTAKIVDYIFFGERNVNVVKVPRKETLLIYAGALKVNGITEALFSLLKHLDKDKYDVTILTNLSIKHHGKEKDAVLNNIKKLVKDYRVLYKFGESIYTRDETLQDQNAFKETSDNVDYPIDAYTRESRRLTGCCKFDTAIDYSGYSYYWAKVVAFANADKYLIYQHNDLYEEQYKVINGKQIHYQNLQGVFKLYKRFDKIVNVSKAICEVNLLKLENYAPKEKFVYAHNILQLNNILGIEEKEEEQSNLNSVHNIEQSFTVKGDKITYYNTFDSSAKELALDEENRIAGIMQAYYEGNYYIKFAYKGLIYGWCKQEDVTPAPDKIIERREVNFYAYVKSVQGYRYYDAPLNTTENTKTLGYMNRLWQVKMNIKEEVITNYGIFWKMYFDNQFVGWARQGALVRIDKNKFKPLRKLKNYVTATKKVNERTLVQNVLCADGIVNKGQHVIYNRAIGTYRAKPKGILDSNNIEQVIVTREVETNKGKSYYVLTDDKNGWVDENSIEVIHRNSAVIEEIPKNIKVKFKRSWFPMFKEMSDINLDIQRHQAFNYYVNANEYQGELTVTKELITSFRRMVELSLDGKVIGYVPWRAVSIVKNEIDTNELVNIDDNYLNFVNVARLSPEKNQLEMVEAMNLLFEERPELKEKIRLYIVGDGVLFNKIKSLIAKYELEEQIIMLGRLNNPYPVMEKCKTLIFPSLYEGQGLVLLEALTLGLDVIASNIPTSKEVLDDGRYGLLANGCEAIDLKEAIIKYLDNNYEFEKFDYKKYNEIAIKEVEDLL